LIENGRKLERGRQQIDRQFTEAVLDQEHAADVAYVEQKTAGIFGFLAFLYRRYSARSRKTRASRSSNKTAGLPCKLICWEGASALAGRTH
jgi:hypothetical protein